MLAQREAIFVENQRRTLECSTGVIGNQGILTLHRPFVCNSLVSFTHRAQDDKGGAAFNNACNREEAVIGGS